jgi:hypothetical protein
MIHPETITEQQSELGNRRAPFASWHLPAFANLSQLQPNESHRRFVAWQVPAGTNREQRTVQAFDGIRRIDHPPHVHRMREQRNHLYPVAPPTGRDRNVFAAPRTVMELGQSGDGDLGIRGAINGLEGRGNWLTIVLVRVVPGVSQPMHSAGLDLRARVPSWVSPERRISRVVFLRSDSIEAGPRQIPLLLVAA